jgi:hypothetical protein
MMMMMMMMMAGQEQYTGIQNCMMPSCAGQVRFEGRKSTAVCEMYTLLLDTAQESNICRISFVFF